MVLAIVAQRRPAHKSAHQPCPFGQSSWADCDLAASRQWGKCKAITGKHEPTPCVRWAADAEGWCGQHFTALKEKAVAAEKDAARTLQLNERIDAYLDWTKDHPSVWDGATLRTQAESTRGLAGVTPTAPISKSDAPRLQKGNKPHRLTELA